MNERIAGEPEAEAVGDRPGERNGGDDEEGGDADLGVVPLNRTEAGEHQCADEDQCGCGGKAGDGSDQRSDEEGEEKQNAGDDRGDAGAASGGDPGGGFDVAGNGAGPGERAEDGGGGVGEEDAVKAGDGVIGCDEAGTLGDSDERADVIEEIDEEEDKDDFENTPTECCADVEVEGGALIAERL